LKQLPAPDDQMRPPGCRPGFPAVGNHEVWDDSDVQGLLSSFPYLKKFGVSDKQLTYKFDYNDARFIFLWTGPYDYRAPTGWSATRPTYEEQMKQLKVWLDEAKATGSRRSSSLSTTQPSAAPAWAPSLKIRIPTRPSQPTRKTWTSSSSTGTSTRLSFTKWTA